MGVTIDWTNIKSWSKYQSYGDKGYHKMAYLRRYDGVNSYWYGESIIKADTLVIDRYCTASNYLELGNVTAAALSFTISAPPNDITSWAVGDEIEVQIDPDDRATLSTPSADTAYMGIFVIDSIRVRDGNYYIEALDRMVYLDQDMDWTGFSTNYPITTVLSNIATQCGITLANSISGFPNASVGWYSNPTMTCRQVVSYIAEVIGACAFMDWDGELRFAWYEPQLDANSNTLEIGSDIAFNRYTKDTAYVIDSFVIGDSNSSTIDADDDGTATYSIIGNALVESARDYVTVSNWADNITTARYTNVTNPYRLFHGGEYEVLPFPYIWPLDVLCVGSDYIPITHVTYRHNANMSLTADVTPVATRASTFTSAQQTVINEMQSETEAINKHFFYANATGAHITTVENDPDSGNNVLIDSSGIYIREDTDVLAEFTSTGAVVGPAAASHAEVSTSGLQVYESDGSTVIANLGYGPGNNSSGVQTNAPFYTLGIRALNKDVGNYSTAEGYSTEASGYCSHSEGRYTKATGRQAHAEGASSTASGIYSHAEGAASTASGDDSHAEGGSTTASGNDSHAEGYYSVASGKYSHAQNHYTIAASEAQTAIGKYNAQDSADTYALIIGNGTADNARSNALTVDWNGGVSCSEIKTNNYLRFTSANNPNYQYGYIVAVDGDANGSVLLIRPGASLIAGGGEYASNRWGVGDISVTNEQTFLGADSAVYIESNGGTIANRKTWTFYNGDITAPNGTVYETKYKTETVTAAALYGFGYTSATNGTMYLDVMLPKKINTGSTVSVSAITAGIRGVNGLVCANSTNVLSNVSSSTVANSGCLRLTLTGMTTNFAANTPVHIYVNSITFTVS